MRIVVAMSGGVDSSVAAGLLLEAGHDVIGVHMKLHDSPAVSSSAPGHCCGLDDALDARRVAARLGFPFYVMDLTEPFKRAVMDDFVAGYLRGETPNPCVRCNGVLKFDILLARAGVLGADALATGHYARTDGQRLYAATDPAKDQSYFLFPLRASVLSRVRFPLGGLTKPEVRAHAARMGLGTAQKPESMEVCFVADDDHTRFVHEAAPDVDAAGEIVDEAGRVLGRHEGYYRYTVGQRRGLGLGTGTPLYVLRVEAATRRVVVGEASRLLATTARLHGVNWLRRPAPEEAVHVRIRHRGALIPCRLALGSDEPTRIDLDLMAPARAVTPGQAAVLYAGDEVLGGGWIQRDAPAVRAVATPEVVL